MHCLIIILRIYLYDNKDTNIKDLFCIIRHADLFCISLIIMQYKIINFIFDLFIMGYIRQRSKTFVWMISYALDHLSCPVSLIDNVQEFV